MKKTIALLLFTLVCYNNTQAQLLKKLKDKASKVMEPKKPDSNTGNNDNNTTATAENTTGNSSKTSSAPPINGSVVFTMASDENLLHDESKIITKNNAVSYSFVIQNKKNEFFLVEDGNRSGPFKESPINSMKSDDEDAGSSDNNRDEISMGDKKDPVAIQYSKTIDGKLYLVFNGKNYGPYDFVSKMIVSNDKKHFFALVTIGSQSPMMAKMGMGNQFMVNDAGLKQKAGTDGSSMPTKFSVSEGFKQCMATIMDQQTQTLLTVTSTNKQETGSMADMYSGGGSKSFVTDKGDIISIPAQSPTQVLVNGKEAAAFKVPIKSMDRLFLTPDISKSVYYEKGKIYRADGTEESLSGVLFPKVVTVGNETAVYYFKIYKTENNTKDVYLCKKII